MGLIFTVKPIFLYPPSFPPPLIILFNLQSFISYCTELFSL